MGDKKTIKQYSIGMKLQFGRYSGQTLRCVWERNIDYISWCLINVPHFSIYRDTISRLQQLYPKIHLSSEALTALEEKDKRGLNPPQERYDYHDDDNNYGQTYGKYKGSYAQDQAGYSDEDIDNVFDGDPGNYWNID